MVKSVKHKIIVAPNSRENEMMTLGCMLTKINCLNIAADSLCSEDFYYSEHRVIFDVLRDFFIRDKATDIHLVGEELKRIEKLDDIGSTNYLTTVAQYAGISSNIEEYIELVKSKSILRKMVYAAQKIEKDALEEPSDVYGALDHAQAELFAISKSLGSRDGKHIKDILSGKASESGIPYLKELQERQESFLEKGKDVLSFTGIPTGFVDLDKTINGLGNSNFIILAARPGMGKTAFVLNIAEHVAFKHKTPVGIFSLEMGAEQLLHRMLCSQTEVESSRIQTGSITPSEYQDIVKKVNEMNRSTVIIEDQPGLRITELRARARRMKEAHDIQLLVIDYLQLLSGSSGYYGSDNRQGEISEISRMLKNLARELNIPILCCSQLSRRVEEREGHRPMMSDLRESGAIEQDADVVIFILRREYYDHYDKPGLAEIIVGKNRHGGVRTFELAFRSEFAQFANYSSIEKEPIEDNSKDFKPFMPTQ